MTNVDMSSPTLPSKASDNASDMTKVKSEEHPPSNRLFVWNIPYTLTNIDLKKILNNATNEQCYTKIFLKKDGQLPGCGTVSFDSIEAATNAIPIINNLELRGRKLQCRYYNVEPVTANNTVYFYSLPYSITWRDLKDLSCRYASVKLASIISKKGLSTGVGFVHCETKEDADAIIANLDGVELRGRKIIVKPYDENYVKPEKAHAQTETQE